jgi:hypothetical protein
MSPIAAAPEAAASLDNDFGAPVTLGGHQDQFLTVYANTAYVMPIVAYRFSIARTRHRIKRRQPCCLLVWHLSDKNCKKK